MLSFERSCYRLCNLLLCSTAALACNHCIMLFVLKAACASVHACRPHNLNAHAQALQSVALQHCGISLQSLHYALCVKGCMCICACLQTPRACQFPACFAIIACSACMHVRLCMPADPMGRPMWRWHTTPTGKRRVVYIRGTNINETINKHLEDLLPDTCTVDYARCIMLVWMTIFNILQGIKHRGWSSIGSPSLYYTRKVTHLPSSYELVLSRLLHRSK